MDRAQELQCSPLTDQRRGSHAHVLGRLIAVNIVLKTGIGGCQKHMAVLSADAHLVVEACVLQRLLRADQRVAEAVVVSPQVLLVNEPALA